jgi:hypothetical protein
MIKVLGYGALYSRPLKGSEVIRMDYVMMILNTYKSRKSAKDIVEWVRENKQVNLALEDAKQAYRELYV